MNLFIPSLVVRRQGLFSPLQISGCKLWIKADTLNSTLADGAVVGTWTDDSGSGNNCTQATGANKPIFKTGIINNLPAVQFDGLAQYMTFPTGIISAGGSNTIFAVVQPTADTSAQNNYATVIGNELTAISIGGFWLTAKIATSFWGTFTQTTGDLSSTNALTSGSKYLLESTETTGSCVLYQKGVQVASRAENEFGLNGASAGLGNDPNHASRFYKGYIAEAILYNSVLSSANRISVENYLIAKYAL